MKIEIMGIIFNSQNLFQILAGLFIWSLFTLVFFQFTQGSGKYIFALFSIFYIVFFVINPPLSFFVASVAGLFLIIQQRSQSRSKEKYQKAIAKFEGGGIRRGLTPPEIGAVLGTPFHQIFTLIIIGLYEKGFVTVNDEHNLQLKVSNPMQTRPHSLNTDRRAKLRRQGAQELKQVMFPFEEPFLELLEQEDGKGIAEIDFSITAIPFYQSVAERLGGYDIDKTREYYIKMVRRFTEGENTPSFSGTRDNREIEWILLSMYLDEEYELGLIEFPSWNLDTKDVSGKKHANITLMDWVINLEEAIKSGLSQEDLKFNLDRMIDKSASEILEDIIRATYHT